MNISSLDIERVKRRKVARVKCQASLLFFTRYFFKQVHKRKFKVMRHLERISDALERVLRGLCRRLLISVPPRYGKTELAVKNFMAHGLSLNPAAKFIHLSASDTLAFDNSEGCKDIVQSPEYRELFPEVQIKQDTDSKKKWYTTDGGGVYATGAAGQVTGFGAGNTDSGDDIGEWLDELTENEQQLFDKWRFGGAIIIDDPIKPDDADADIKRERVNRRWSSTIKSRLNSRNTPVIVIMQRLHPMDMIGYLQAIEPGEWEVVSLPALFVNEQGQLEALDPSKHTVEDLQAMEHNADAEVRLAFQRQYQQNPKPREGLSFPDGDLKYYKPSEVDVMKLSEYRAAQIDPADTGGDDLGMPIGYLIGDKVYVTDVVYSKKGTDVTEPICIGKIVEHELHHTNIESNGGWVSFGKAIQRKVKEVAPNSVVRLYPNTTNKHTRIIARAAFIKKHFVFRDDWQTCSEDYRRFMENLTSYREDQSGANKNKHDDAPDSLAGLAEFFYGRFKHLW